MSKGKQRPPQYNRQTKGYQQNLQKKMMKDQNVELPKPIDMEKWTKINRILGIAWIIVTVLLSFLVNWKAGIASLVVGLLYLGGFTLYINNYLKKYITAYKKMGIPKDVYLKQLRRSGNDVKQIERMSRMWDRAKVD